MNTSILVPIEQALRFAKGQRITWRDNRTARITIGNVLGVRPSPGPTKLCYVDLSDAETMTPEQWAGLIVR
jgi:hypothetical protein